MKKHITLLSTILLSSIFYIGCNKKEGNNPQPAEDTIIERTFDVVSIIGTASGDIDSTRKGFINLYEGTTYSQTEAAAVSSKIDFAYNYHGGGCSTCRFFENVKQMSTRTWYVEAFSTVTNSSIANAEHYYGVTPEDFGNIRSADDIDNLFSTHSITPNGMADITDRTTDVATGRVFAFIDKSGKKGFFLIGDYIAGVPTGHPATLNLKVKIQK